MCDTSGFNLNNNAEIRRELNGTIKLALFRDSVRMVPSLHIWRANGDVQLLLYQSNPRNPDLLEMSKVTDYFVSYACKGNLRMESEVNVLSSLVIRYVIRVWI